MDLDFLKNFIKQSFQKDSQETKGKYPEKLFDLFIKVSFGFGGFANIPHLGFYKSNSKKKASKGFYPVFLHYREKGILILSYGVSDKEQPEKSWNNIIHDSAPKIKDFKSPCGEFDLINTKKLGFCDDSKDIKRFVDFIKECKEDDSKRARYQINNRKASFDFTKKNARLLFDGIEK